MLRLPGAASAGPGTGRAVLAVPVRGCQQGHERQRGTPRERGRCLRAGLGAVEDADALGDVLAAQGARVQPLAAALAAADVATGQENHLGLRERQRGDTESAAVPEHRSQHGGSWGSLGGPQSGGQSPAPRSRTPLSVRGLGCAEQERDGTQGRIRRGLN